MHLPHLPALVLGNHKATKDLGEHPNHVMADTIIKLIENHDKLKVLNVSKMGLASDEMDRVYAVAQKKKILMFGKDSITQYKKYLHPESIGNIESIYRTEAM